MSLTAAEIGAVVRDLKPKLEGGRIERIDQPQPDRLTLTIRNGPALYWLLLCAHPRFSRLHLLTHRPEQAKSAAGFCNVVRQHMTGAPLTLVEQVAGDRVVRLESVETDRLMQPHRVSLVAELVGVGSNLVLLDESDGVLGVLHREDSSRRKLAPGLPYEPLAARENVPDAARQDRFDGLASEDDPLALSRAIQGAYAREEDADRREGLRSELRRLLTGQIKSRRRRLRKVTKDLHNAQQAERTREKGELLKIALPQLKRGQREVVVEDLFHPGGPPVTIEIDPTRTPQENLDRIFRRYKKAKAGEARLAGRAADTERQIGRLEERLAAVEGCAAAGALEDLRRTLEAEGLLPVRPARPRPRGRAGQGGPRAFRSADGFDILVARNQRQNDKLTFTIARGNDYWLHLLDWTGPHVVVRKPVGRSVSGEAVIDAAHLAVYFSRLRGAHHAEVVYTQCKNVRRLRGAAPGKVSYSSAKTMRVRLEPERYDRLLNSGGGS